MFRFSTPYFEIEPHTGAFSIKLVLSGKERYFFRRRTVPLRPGQILLVNAGDEYSSLIDTPTESLSVFFCESELHSAVRSMSASNESLLDAPDNVRPVPEVARVAIQNTPEFQKSLRAAIAAIDRCDNIAMRESVRTLLPVALADHWGVAPPHSLAGIRRRSTRDELISRVLRARTLIDDSPGQNLDLGALAHEACLSRFHFLRVFTELVGETPIAYARRRRLDDGQQRMRRGERPEAAAQLAGYKSVRNFSRAFRNTFGCAPEFRKSGPDEPG